MRNQPPESTKLLLRLHDQQHCMTDALFSPGKKRRTTQAAPHRRGRRAEMSRPSWYLCDECREPHTEANPLERLTVVGAKVRAYFNLHKDCIPAVQARLLPDYELRVLP